MRSIINNFYLLSQRVLSSTIGVILCLGILLCSNPSWVYALKTADNSINVTSAIVQTKAPQDSQFTVLSLTVSNLTAASVALSQLKVQAQSDPTKFGQGIEKIDIYEDTNSNSAFEVSDRQLASNTFTSYSIKNTFSIFL